ncbi:MAG: sugar phosphate nucleotidyltransferase [bacterium]|jgi:NDP-sugar pyrophosphorylase family protein|nr:sugar phosphate nucleotidyltransferase [bacterium]
MRAVIMAGGKGKRLFPYTLVLPKPLVPLGEKPILDIVLRQLAHAGFDHITITVGYHAELIMAVMGDGSNLGIKIDYALESKPLNTIGPLTQVKDLNEPFLVMNGDLLTNLDYKMLYETHLANQTIATVATHKRHVRLSLGVVRFDGDHRINGFQEKPEYDYDVSMGIYIFNPEILEHIPKGEPFGFDQLILRLLDQQVPVAAYPFTGNWLDMGTMDDLNRAMEEFEANKALYLPGEPA